VFKRWKDSFATDKKRKIGCIPFIRNLVEYTKGTADPIFGKLTGLLHWKPNSMQITETDLETIYNSVFSDVPPAAGASARSMIDIIHEEADKCLTDGTEGINFENKIVLSIAIRLAAEKFMVDKISNPAFWAAITSMQTGKLFGEYVRLFGRTHDSAMVLDRVMLMTPENIHLNSFMYEPIVDMADQHLRDLYTQTLALK
jgi:hypothetical protein